MNHFLLPVQRAPDLAILGLSQEGRYGIDAMELLINGMLKAGAQKPRLRAKVFGGASLLTAPDTLPAQAVGEGNIRFVREFLTLEGIPLESEDLGGFRGRVIHFHTDTFAVWRRYIRNRAQEDTIRAEETAAWKRQVRLRGAEGDVTLFS